MRDDESVAYRAVLRLLSKNEEFISVISTAGDGLLLASKRG
jgi:hypothetical protein